MHETTDEFIKEFGEDLLQDIVEALICRLQRDKESYEHINFIDIHQNDVINHDAYGTITFEDGREIFFELENGNRAGTRILDYGEEIDEPKYYANIMKMVLDTSKFTEDELPAAMSKYHDMKEEIDEMARNYSYDKHFTGSSSKTEQHYKNWMSKHNLIVEYETIEVDANHSF